MPWRGLGIGHNQLGSGAGGLGISPEQRVEARYVLSRSRIGWALELNVALELLEMEWEMASFSPGPILFAFPTLAHFLVWGLRVSFLFWCKLPPAQGLRFPIFEITT